MSQGVRVAPEISAALQPIVDEVDERLSRATAQIGATAGKSALK